MLSSRGIFTVLTLLLCTGGMFFAPGEVLLQEHSDSKPPEASFEIEEIEEIEEISPVEVSGEQELSLLELLGRLHPAVVHFPIGWLVMLFLIDSGAFFLKRAGWEKWGFYALLGTLLSFLPAIITGFLNADFQPSLENEQLSLVTTHRNTMIAAAVICFIAFSLRAFKHNLLTGAYRWIYLVLIAAAVGLAGFGGHLGGKMVFGIDYLPF